jgi:hypothetical protein
LYTQKYIMREIKSKGSGNWRDIYHACEIWDIHKNFLRSENLKTRDHLEDRGVYGGKKYSARWVNVARRCRLDVSGSGYVPDADSGKPLMKLPVPQYAENLLTSWDIIKLSIMVLHHAAN